MRPLPSCAHGTARLRVDGATGEEDDASVREHGSEATWSDEYEDQVRSEHHRVARSARRWTFVLLLVVAVAFTATVAWYALFLLGSMGD